MDTYTGTQTLIAIRLVNVAIQFLLKNSRRILNERRRQHRCSALSLSLSLILYLILEMLMRVLLRLHFVENL